MVLKSFQVGCIFQFIICEESLLYVNGLQINKTLSAPELLGSDFQKLWKLKPMKGVIAQHLWNQTILKLGEIQARERECIFKRSENCVGKVGHKSC